MTSSQGALAVDFELTVEACADARPLPGFHVTRTRTFFVDNHGRVYLLAMPGQRAMLALVEALPPSAGPTRDVDATMQMMARVAQALGAGQHELTPLRLASYFAWRTRLFLVHAGQVHELRREADKVHFDPAPALPTGAIPFTEAEALRLGEDVHRAARRLGTH